LLSDEKFNIGPLQTITRNEARLRVEGLEGMYQIMEYVEPHLKKKQTMQIEELKSFVLEVYKLFGPWALRYSVSRLTDPLYNHDKPRAAKIANLFNTIYNNIQERAKKAQQEKEAIPVVAPVVLPAKDTKSMENENKPEVKVDEVKPVVSAPVAIVVETPAPVAKPEIVAPVVAPVVVAEPVVVSAPVAEIKAAPAPVIVEEKKVEITIPAPVEPVVPAVVEPVAPVADVKPAQ
jgi:hypothetical protein